MAGFASLETNPLRTGLIWGATFIPGFVLLTWVSQDRWLTTPEWLGLIPGALGGGVVWAFIYRRLLRGEKRHAR